MNVLAYLPLTKSTKVLLWVLGNVYLSPAPIPFTKKFRIVGQQAICGE